jgi:hypothetical protein
MTRLTDEVIEREWNECVTLRGDGVWYRRFASRIAALAVAEYRSREVANLLAQLAERENLLTAVMESRAETEAQLAEARAKWADTDSRNTALRAQLATAKREYRHDCAEWHNEGIGCTHCHRVIYPATPSGQWCVRCGDTCKPWCHNATPLPAPDHSKAQSLAEQLARDTEFSGDGLYNLARAYQSVREEQVTETATDLSECERWADEIRHWVVETVPEPALAAMLSALRNLEAASGCRVGADAKRIMDMAQRNI